ncbi:MAG TPA: protein-methionine-sulfoxide reductase catalytic subunit MsrP [Acetobacteraceae bacterium]|jgi:sulfoxide reductase catalytic subunit YedY|nr:protein-methionine-sulfoxide reductase catalytic subunit MsrP [Acetobacteraceae bacterium]
MFIHRQRGWELPERDATPEPLVLGRRRALAGAAAVGLAPIAARAAAPVVDTKYPPGRAITPEQNATTYNNYYEFSDDKDLWRAAQKLPQSPWSVAIGGEVEKPFSIALPDLLKQVQLQDRVLRHRCVEAWAMTVPWTGFPLADLVKLARPTSAARYVVFHTIEDRKVMPGLSEVWYPWPYTEGVTMAEANNDLAFLATGMYGKPVPPQDGGPIRLLLPWKYGFKSAKALNRITFAAKQPLNFWQALAPNEYGFWANVNPAVPHPRWSQRTERLIGSGERVPTQIYNGYGEWVAPLYAGPAFASLKSRKLFM